MSLSIDFRAHSETGLVRKNNQDSGYASPTMLLVADGMGGAAAGDLASTVAVREIMRSDGAHSLDSCSEVLTGAMARANHLLADLVEQDPSLDGMGTTVVGGLVSEGHFSLLHLGDSRAYLLRAGSLYRLTHDHSWVQSLVDDGKISVAEAAVHPHRSLLLKVLNGQSQHDPDLEDIPLAVGDRLLLCSDGLCGFVPDPTIRSIVSSTDDLDRAMDQLVAAAHAGGGADNITVLLADVVPADPVLDARRPEVVGAAFDGVVPETQEHTLAGSELSAIAAKPEPTAPTERYLEGPDELAALDAEQARYAPRDGLRHPVRTMLASALAFALVASAGLYGAWRYAQTQYYVGADQAQVAVFRGVPGSVLGKPLQTVVERPGILLADLPTFFQQQVTSTIQVANLGAADSTVAQLRTRAEQCIARRQASPSPSPSATPSASARASASPTPAKASSGSAASTTTSAKPTPATSSASPKPSAAVSSVRASSLLQTPQANASATPSGTQEC